MATFPSCRVDDGAAARDERRDDSGTPSHRGAITTERGRSLATARIDQGKLTTRLDDHDLRDEPREDADGGGRDPPRLRVASNATIATTPLITCRGD